MSITQTALIMTFSKYLTSKSKISKQCHQFSNMNFSRLFFNINTSLTASIAFVAVAGDYITTVSNNSVLKAMCDNITHAVIGGLCWCICYFNRDKTDKDPRSGFREVLGCTVLASVIDLDHFIAAKSVLLKDAVSLTHRPFLHCSTIPLVLFPTALLLSYILECPPLKRGGLILLAAFATHHIRDATRRGLWFYPYGSTAPIPYGMYIVLTCLIPYGIILVDRFFKVEGYSESKDSLDVI